MLPQLLVERTQSGRAEQRYAGNEAASKGLG